MSTWEEQEDFLARWLSGDLSKEEKAAFEDSEKGKAYIRMIQAADKLQAPRYDVARELEKFRHRVRTTNERKTGVFLSKSFRWAVAASITALLVVAYFLLGNNLTEISTLPGQQEIVILPDGSEVKLNSSSTLGYNPDAWDEKRRIVLKGEAFFEVKEGIEFIVETRGGDVRVLGTSFNVRSRGRLLDVVCYTGRVKVSSKKVDRDLTRGSAIRLNNGDLERQWTKELEDVPAWLEGITVLEDVPLSEALDELRSVFGIDIRYDNSLDGLEYNGAFPNDNPSAAIQLVLKPLNIRYTYDSLSQILIIEGAEQ